MHSQRNNKKNIVHPPKKNRRNTGAIRKKDGRKTGAITSKYATRILSPPAPRSGEGGRGGGVAPLGGLRGG